MPGLCCPLNLIVCAHITTCPPKSRPVAPVSAHAAAGKTTTAPSTVAKITLLL